MRTDAPVGGGVGGHGDGETEAEQPEPLPLAELRPTSPKWRRGSSRARRIHPWREYRRVSSRTAARSAAAAPHRNQPRVIEPCDGQPGASSSLRSSLI